MVTEKLLAIIIVGIFTGLFLILDLILGVDSLAAIALSLILSIVVLVASILIIFFINKKKN